MRAKLFHEIVARGLSAVASPLTPALSLGERESRSTALADSRDLGFTERLATVLPLPEGEGRGEGARATRPATKLDCRGVDL